MRIYRINAVGKEGLPIVLATADNATKALQVLRDAFGDFPRAWVSDDQDNDVSLADLLHVAGEEQKSRD